MEIIGSKITLNKSAQEVFDFLNQVSNFEKLMPENIDKFQVLNDNAFLFALKGMPEIALEKKSEQAPTQLVLGAKSDKLPFTLTGNIESEGTDSCNVQLHFAGEFNPMMAMMIKGPITKFIDTLSEHLGQI
jgi:ribosome-associated toxin RatA of RatAB toxin-antitoxin module